MEGVKPKHPITLTTLVISHTLLQLGNSWLSGKKLHNTFVQSMIKASTTSMNSPALANSDLVLNLFNQDRELEEHGEESQTSQAQFETWFRVTFIGLGDQFNGLQKSNR